MKKPPLVRARAHAKEAEALVAELLLQFSPLDSQPAGIFLFRSPAFDDERLAQALNAAFDCPVSSCTTAGEIFDDYHQGVAVAIAFSSRYFAFHQLQIPNLTCYDFGELAPNVHKILEQRVFGQAGRFGVLRRG